MLKMTIVETEMHIAANNRSIGIISMLTASNCACQHRLLLLQADIELLLLCKSGFRQTSWHAALTAKTLQVCNPLCRNLRLVLR